MNKLKKCKSLMSLTDEEHNRYFTKFYDWKINGGNEKRFHKDTKRRYQVNFLMFCFKYRSSHQRCSMKKGVLKNFHKIHRKTPVPESGTGVWHRCFPVNFVKSLRTPFFTEHLWMTASISTEILYKLLYFICPSKVSHQKIKL